MNHNLIQMNRYCNDFHDDDRIIFCKIDFILNEFKKISNHNKNVILIVANGDITFNDHILSLCPKNVKHIFSTNTTCDNDFVTPIPIGVEMNVESKRIGHGSINKEIFEKLPFLTGDIKIDKKTYPNKLYSNFNINTNLSLRSKVKEISLSSPNILFEFGLKYPDFVNQVKNHLATISPRGNGIECIRTYEVLYLNEIPIVVGNHKEYKPIFEKIYKNLPILFVDNIENLKNLNFIETEINKIKNNSRESLFYDYWYKKIKEKINKII